VPATGGLTAVLARFTAGVLIRYVLVGSIGLAGVQALWQWSGSAAAVPPPIAEERIAQLQITLGQAIVALRDYAKTGSLHDRFDYNDLLGQFREALQRLESGARDMDEKKALTAAWSATDRIRSLGTAVAQLEGTGRSVDPALVQELPRLREQAAVALTDFRSVGLLRMASALPTPLTGLLRGAAAAAAGVLTIALGAINLWSRLNSV
jgi:hypothetical protein